MNSDSNPQMSAKAQVIAEFEKAKEFARGIDFKKVQNGDWFKELLIQVAKSYEKNGRAEYFQQKYPGLSADEIADKLISVTVRYAAIAGAVAGIAVSANQIAVLGSAGMTAALFVTSIGAEMIYLARLQMRLVLDLAVVYDLQLDPDDPEDILMIFGYALGVSPTEILGKGLQVAAGTVTRTTIKTYISKGTLKAIQDFARQLGFKILQRTIIKYAVPAVSAGVGSGYNYTTTLSVGKIAKAHFKNRGKVTEELRLLISRQHTYELVYPAAVLYVAQIDGKYSEQERQLYKSMLSRMSFDRHVQEDFQHLLKNEESLLEEISKIDDPVASETLLELVLMMVVYDGWLADEELSFLTKLSQTMGVEIDETALAKRAKEYQIKSDNRWQKFSETTAKAIASKGDTVSQFLQNSTEGINSRLRRLARNRSSLTDNKLDLLSDGDMERS